MGSRATGEKTMTRHSSTYDRFEYGADDSLLRRYLLRDLGLKDVQEVERRIFFEDLFFKRADIVESELVEEYVRGALSEPDRRRFERNYLCTPERRNLVQTTRHLAALKPRKAATPAVLIPSPSRTRGPRRSRNAGVWAWGAVAAAVLIAFALGISRSSLWPAKTAPNYLGASAAPSSASTTVDRELDFDASGTRGLPTLVASAPASAMRVRWRSSSPITGERYPATLETEAGSTLWSGEAYRLPTGEYAITVPAGTIQPGVYRIRLQNSTVPGHSTVIEFAAVQ